MTQTLSSRAPLSRCSQSPRAAGDRHDAAVPPRRLPAAEHVHDGATCSAATPASCTRCAASSHTAAPFIGVAIVLDMLDGRIARMTGTTSEFGVEFDSLADVISFGVAPAILAFQWGLQPLGRLGWAAGFLFVAAAAVRLARFNIQTGAPDKRYFVGMPSPAAAAVPAATIFCVSRAGFTAPWQARWRCWRW